MFPHYYGKITLARICTVSELAELEQRVVGLCIECGEQTDNPEGYPRLDPVECPKCKATALFYVDDLLEMLSFGELSIQPPVKP